MTVSEAVMPKDIDLPIELRVLLKKLKRLASVPIAIFLYS